MTLALAGDRPPHYGKIETSGLSYRDIEIGRAPTGKASIYETPTINNEDPNAIRAATLGSPTITHKPLCHRDFGDIVREHRVWIKEDTGSCVFSQNLRQKKTPNLNRVWLWAFDTRAQRGSKA